MTDINTSVNEVAQEFAKELQRLRTRGDRDQQYQDDTLSLRVSVGPGGKAKFELIYGHGYGEGVKASTLGALMDEVYRREGFDDREQGKMQAQGNALLALPPSVSAAELESDTDNDILF